MTWQPEQRWKLPEYLWDKERETCMACKHYHEFQGGVASRETSTVMACRLSPKATAVNHGTCITMRYEGECGREARLFEPRSR
jgi:hypothetical protein